MEKTESRQAIANEILELFRADTRVKDVFLRGSLKGGITDEYSDIDIGIDVSGHDNAAYCQTIIETMAGNFDLHFYDWACSLMPDHYVLSFFVKGLPIYWNIDFDCSATPHFASMTRKDVSRDSVASCFKVWALNTKYLLRRKPGIEQEVRDYWKRITGTEAPSHVSPVEVMVMALEYLEAKATERHREFAALCRVAYEEQLRPIFNK